MVLPTEKLEAVVHEETIKLEVPEHGFNHKIHQEVRLKVELPNSHGTQELGLTNWAHRQLAEKCGIPVKYYDKMLESGKLDLVTHNVNEWIRGRDQRMIRMLGDKVRAIVSDRYFRLDNYIVATEMFNKMEEHGLDSEKDVDSCHLSDTRMYIRLIIPYMQDEIKKGDVVKQGLIISNSEVGCGAFKAEPFLWRLVCSNGMIAPHRMARVHLGSKHKIGELDLDIYSDKTRELELATVISQIQDIIEGTFDPDFFHKWTDILRRGSEIEIPSPTEAVDHFTKLYSMKHAKDDLLDRLVKEGDPTQYGLVNAITSYAKDEAPTIDRQVELERIAGEVSFMEEREFQRKIAPAAVVA